MYIRVEVDLNIYKLVMREIFKNEKFLCRFKDGFCRSP